MCGFLLNLFQRAISIVARKWQSNRSLSADENGATVGEEDSLLKELLESWVSPTDYVYVEYESM